MTNQEVEKYIKDNLMSMMTQQALDEGMMGHIVNICIDIKDCLINDRIPCSFVKHCLNEDWDRAKAVADRWNKDTLNETDFYPNFLHQVKTSSEYIQKIREKNISILIN